MHNRLIKAQNLKGDVLVLRPVVSGGAGGAMAPPDFGRSVNPISTKGDRLCPPNITGTPRFFDLPTALYTVLPYSVYFQAGVLDAY